MNVQDRKNAKKKMAVPSLMQAKPVVLLVIIVCVILLVLLAVTLLKSNDDEVRQGIQYLKKIDSKEALIEAEEAIKTQRAEAITKMITEATSGGEESSFDPWSYFSDSVILGDSRAVGFYVYDFLPQSRVLAAPGNTIKTIDDHIGVLQSVNPSYVFLAYGLNDLVSAQWSSAKEWCDDYGSYIEKIQNALPNTKIYVNSILPVADNAFGGNGMEEMVTDYSNDLRDYCADHDIKFIDCNDLPEKHPDYFESDGKHFRKAFYPYWAAEMIVTAYIGNDGQNDQDTDGQ